VTSAPQGLRPGRLVARLIAVCGLVLATGVAAVAVAEDSSAAACPSSSGVTVVVDIGSLGGTSVGCASSPGSGLDALKATGHSVTYVPRQPGLVCTIDRRPDPCNGAPTTAYWSYWRASAGGTWSYSTVGAAGTHPKGGTVEGWAFGAGKPPAMRPPSRPRPTTSSTTSTSRTSTHRPTSASAAGSSRGGSTGAGSVAGTTKARTTTSPTRSTATTAPASTAATDDTAATDGTGAPSGPSTPDVLTATRTDAGSPTSATSDSGGTGTLVVAAALVLLLAGGGGVIAWRRRGRDA
jgi:hypothetical protein